MLSPIDVDIKKPLLTMDCDKELKIGLKCDFNDCFHVEIFIDNSKTLFTTDYLFKELCAKFQKIECLVTFINGQQTNFKSKTQINESFQILLNTSLMISPTSINVNTNEIYNFLVQIHSKMCAHVKSDLQIKKICTCHNTETFIVICPIPKCALQILSFLFWF